VGRGGQSSCRRDGHGHRGAEPGLTGRPSLPEGAPRFWEDFRTFLRGVRPWTGAPAPRTTDQNPQPGSSHGRPVFIEPPRPGGGNGSENGPSRPGRPWPGQATRTSVPASSTWKGTPEMVLFPDFRDCPTRAATRAQGGWRYSATKGPHAPEQVRGWANKGAQKTGVGWPRKTSAHRWPGPLRWPRGGGFRLRRRRGHPSP